ncbi:MAG TPA: flagellar biosynthetic protein FliO [Candidatus Tumulicola sp.]|jgi:flagellar biogenesis protein FliO
MPQAFWLRYLAAILFVGALLWVAARLGRWLRSRGLRGAASRIRAIESVALAPNASVHLIDVDGCEFVVVVGGSAATVSRPRDSMQ